MPGASVTNGRASGSFATAGLLLLALALVLRALVVALVHRVPLAFLLGPRFFLVVLGLLLAGLLVVLEAALWNRDRESPAASAWRWTFVATVSSWLLFLTYVQPFQRLWFDLAVGGTAGAFASGLLFERWLTKRSERASMAFQWIAFSLCAGLLGLELCLRAWAGARPSVLFARVGGGPAELVNRFRCKPGEVHLGFECNSRGFYDEEFYRQHPGDDREHIVAIGDSFSVGAVPQPWHYSSVCEELLGARVDSMGVAGIGPPEYLSLLVDEALPLDPDRIVIGIFVGNDLNVEDALDDLPDPALRAWGQRDQVLLFVVPERMARIGEERARLGEQLRGGQDKSPAVLDREQALARFPWVEDPSLEEAPLSEATFLRLETDRALDLCAQDPPSLELCFESLLAAKQAAGATPLAVILIPDEFQVEDRLWERILERASRPLDRTRPQRLLRRWLDARGIPHLDLLPILRAVPPLEDGDRHLYHARDTHFNARGNEVTGQAMAEFLRSL
jgi:hypothetical protein